jgi:hypothetical protein
MPRRLSHFSFLSALSVSVLLSWLPQLQPYLRSADDFRYAIHYHSGLWSSIADAYAASGIRRSAYLLFFAPVTGLPDQWIGLATVAEHLLATILFYFVAFRLLGNRKAAFMLGIAFGVFPFAFGAVVWATGTYIIVHSIFYLLSILLLSLAADSARGSIRRAAALTGAVLMTLACCLAGEHLAFASALSGLLVLSTKAHDFAQLRSVVHRQMAIFILPAATVAIYLIAVWLSAPTGSHGVHGGALEIKSLNIRALLSVWFYQHRMLDIFEPWFSEDAWNITFSSLPLALISAAGILVIAAIWLIGRIAGSRASEVESARQSPLLGLAIILSGFAISSVHMLAGGYSAASRHQYVPIMFVFLFVGWLVLTVLPRPNWYGTRFRLIGTALVLVGCISTWLIIGINRFELRRHHALIDHLVSKRISGPISVSYTPAPWHVSPKLGRALNHPQAHGYGAEWILREAIRDAKSPIRLSEADAATLIDVRLEQRSFIVTSRSKRD